MTPEEKAKAKEQASRLMVKQPEPVTAPKPLKRDRSNRDSPIQIYIKRAKSITLYSVHASKGGKRFTSGDYTSVEDAARAAGEWKAKQK